MESSDPFQNYEESQAQQQQGNSGLMRYRSAPSSYFTSLLDRDIYDDFLNRPSSPETERILSGLMNGGFRQRDESGTHRPENIEPGKGKVEIFQRQPKQEQEPQRTDYSQHHQSFYQNNSPQQMFPNQNIDYRSVGSAGDGGSAGSGLLRQSSSPAGLFMNNLNSIEVSGAMRFNASTQDVSHSSATRFNPMNYLSSGQPSSSGQMSPIAEIGLKNLGKRTDGAEVRGFGEDHGDNYDAGFALGSWEDSGLNALEAEGLEIRDSTPQLAHHFSLPKSSLDIERLLQFQDSVPCKIRAKRGCATHPRSIAERVRRTKISERIRKLQDLVPNMDKQTNTTEMLDLAVDYIKELQEQVKMLSDSKSKCMCSRRQMQ